MEAALNMAEGADVFPPPLLVPPGLLRGGRVSFQYEQPDGRTVKVSYKVKPPLNKADRRSRTKSVSVNLKDRFLNWRRSTRTSSGFRRRSLSLDDINTAYEHRPLPPIPADAEESVSLSAPRTGSPFDHPVLNQGSRNLPLDKRHSSYNPYAFISDKAKPDENKESAGAESQEGALGDLYVDMKHNSQRGNRKTVTDAATGSHEISHDRARDLLKQFDTYEIPTKYRQKVKKRTPHSPMSMRSRLSRQNTIEETQSASYLPRDAVKVDINPRFLKRSRSCDALTLLTQWEMFQEFYQSAKDVFESVDYGDNSSDSDSDEDYDREEFLLKQSERFRQMSLIELPFGNPVTKTTSAMGFEPIQANPRESSNKLPKKLQLSNVTVNPDNNKSPENITYAVINKLEESVKRGLAEETPVREEVWV